MTFGFFSKSQQTIPRVGMMVEHVDTSHINPEMVMREYEQMNREIVSGQISKIVNTKQRQEYESRWKEIGEQLNRTVSDYNLADHVEQAASLHDKLAVIYLEIAQLVDGLNTLVASLED